MNYTQDIAPLESAGLSDAQIAAVLSSVTVKPVDFQLFNNYMYEQGLASKHPITGKWQGPLPELSESEGHPLQDGVGKLYSHLNKPQSVQIDTSIQDVKELIATGRLQNGVFERQPWCLMAAELLAGLVAMQIITPEHRDGFYALGGGLKHGAVTVEQVAAVRDQHALNTYASELSQRIGGAVALAAAAEGATEASVKAAAVAEASS